MIHFTIYNFIVRLFKLFTQSINTSRLLASIVSIAVEIAIICNVNNLFVRIVESVFLLLVVLNCVRRTVYFAKRQKIKVMWLKYHSDLGGLDQLVSTQRILSDMIYNLSENKEGMRISKREKSYMETYAPIMEAISEAFSFYERNEISTDTMLKICRNTINYIETAFESYSFDPEYLNKAIPDKVRNIAMEEQITNV